MSEIATTDAEMSPHLRAIFAERAAQLQMLPSIAIEALAIAKRPNCTIAEFVSVVERDAKLASDILSMSNSPLFANTHSPSITLQQSVMRLGFCACRNLILSTSLSSMMRTLKMKEEWVRDILSQHAFLTGATAVCVNRIAGTAFQGEEFAAGLLHDVGRALIAVCMPDEFSSVDPMNFEENSQTPEKESWIIETNHCQTGAWFAQVNGLPKEFVEVIRHHHHPSTSKKYRRLVTLIAVSDHIANHMQRYENSEHYDITTNEAISVLEGTGVPNVAERLNDLMPEIMNSARQATKQFSM